MGVVMWRDNGCETVMKGNDSDGWNSDGVVLLVREEAKWIRG
jgi:hypothetical protein